jgi:hypothetical protein
VNLGGMDKVGLNKILLFCIGKDGGEKGRQLLAALTPADWESLIQQSFRHDVAPLLYYQLNNNFSDVDIPKKIRLALKTMYLYSVQQNSQLYNDLFRVLEALKDDGIPVIALKGVHLAKAVYGNTALRPMCDIDIMIKKKDLEHVEDRLLMLGYGPTKGRQSIEERCAYHHHLDQFNKPGNVPIEVHWNIAPVNAFFRIDLNGIWERAEKTQFSGRDVWLLSIEDLLLHLCLHVSYNHQFSIDFKHIYDIYELIHQCRHKMNWEQLIRTAHVWRMHDFIYTTLSVTSRIMMAAEVPSSVLKALKPEKFDEQITRVVEEFMMSEDHLDIPIGYKESMRKKELKGKLYVLFGSIFPPLNRLREMYSADKTSNLIYFYYLIRPFDLFFRKFQVMLSLAFSTHDARLSMDREHKRIVIEDWVKHRSSYQGDGS